MKALEIARQRMNEALARVSGAGAKAARAGRLLFALDLTGSREHSIEQARIATEGMFNAIRSIGRLAVKLVYYRGADECRASAWHSDPGLLSEAMTRLACEVGETQIARVLRLALAEPEGVSSVVFVGDHCEEKPKILGELAAMLGQRSIPLFVFHECADRDRRSVKAKPLFKHLAEASGGAYVEFKPDSGATLRELLSSVAAFSTAGVEGVRQAPLPQTPEAKELRGRLLMLSSGEKPSGRFDVLRGKA